ncbi:MAG: S1 RNA-binding domain-containing protein, partial [Deltaproteobacteria bacterium]|nr:S1 RNA-binding domain-containing protein [Deltaproteobacteria bacterium]
VSPGDRPGRPKIALSIKQTTADPWLDVEGRFHPGEKVSGRVTRCVAYGAFVELTPGIEGLVHISELSYTQRVMKPEDIVRPGESISAVVKEIDPFRRRISLSIKDAEGDPWLDAEERYKVGQTVMGTLEKKEKFGFFISLEPGITGLLPMSSIGRAGRKDSLDQVRPGQGIGVVVRDIRVDQRRITLDPAEDLDENEWKSYSKKNGGSLGSLGLELQKALMDKDSGTPED